MGKEIGIEDLIGKTLVSVTLGKYVREYEDDAFDEIVFVTDNGEKYRMYHDQDCCETVTIEDIAGDLQDLVGSPIVRAEEKRSDNRVLDEDGYRVILDYDEGQTWTFYTLATVKGYVDIRWYGTSNGYYSEEVTFGRG